MEVIQEEARSLFIEKNTEYEGILKKNSILDILTFIENHVTYLNAKICSLNSEEIRNDLIDLHNYAIIAIMYLDKKLKLKRELEKTTSLVSRDIDDDELVRRIMRGEVVRFI